MKRKIVFDSTQQEILQLMSEMGIEPSTEFEQDAVCEDSDTFRMSSDRMRELSNLLNDVCVTSVSMHHFRSKYWVVDDLLDCCQLHYRD
jgi:hypothetical protein